MDYMTFLPTLSVVGVSYAGVAGAVVADLVSGLNRSRRHGDKTTSHGLRRTVEKLGTYFRALTGLTAADAVLLAALFCWREAGGGANLPLLPALTALGAVAIMLIEIKSVAENTTEGGTLREALSLIKELLKRVWKH